MVVVRFALGGRRCGRVQDRARRGRARRQAAVAAERRLFVGVRLDGVRIVIVAREARARDVCRRLLLLLIGGVRR